MKEGWIYKNLNEVCEKGSSSITINKLGDCNGDYPLFGASGLVKYVDFYHQDKPYIGIVKDGAGVGRVNIYPAYSSLVGTMQYIFAKEDCLLDYLKYFLVKLDLSHCVSGATIPHIYFKDYGKEKIPVPPIETQEAIVSELNQLKELIGQKESQLNDFDNLERSLFVEMFGDPIENNKGWASMKLGDLTEVGTGSTPDRNNESYYIGNNPWIKSTEVCNCAIFDVQEHISDEALKETNCTLYPVNTILMAMYGQGKTRGQVAIMKLVACTNQAVAAILPSKNLEPDYLYQHLRLMYDNIRSMARGGNQANLNLSLVKSIKVMVPPNNMQQQFCERVNAIEQQKHQVNSTLRDLETLLASRLQYWFT